MQLTWPSNHGVWWNTNLQGTRAQIGGALEELAKRITIDVFTQTLLRADPHVAISYDLMVSGRGTVLLHYSLVPAVLDLPAHLRAHAAEIRTRQLR